MLAFRASLACFSRIPVGTLPDEAFKHATRRLPFVGLVIGFVLVAVTWCVSLLFNPIITSLCGLATWIAITGGIHLDGVADCGDGLFMEAPSSRRLEVMKDSRLGAFGAITLFMVLGAKWAGLASICNYTEQYIAFTRFFILSAPIILASVLGRSLVFLAVGLPSARPNGMGHAMSPAITHRDKMLALALSCLALFWATLFLGMGTSCIMLVAGLGAGLCILTKAKSALGGVTGDVYGFLIEGVECAVLCTCLA